MKNTGRLFFLCLTVLVIFNVRNISGTNKNDSLQNRLHVAAGEDRLHTIDRLLIYTIYNDLDTSYYYATTLLKEAKELNNPLYESLAYSWLTVYSFFRGEYYKGENYIKKAIKIQEQLKDTMNLGNSYINLVMIYAETGRYKRAIESAFKALELFKAIGNEHGIIVANGNIGIMYNKLQDYDNAVKYLRITAGLMIKYKEFSNIGELYNNMGLSYYHLNQSDSALEYFNKAIKKYDTNKESKGTARAYLNLANTYAYNIKNYDSAFHYYNLSLKASEGVIDGLKTKIYGNMGRVYHLTGNDKQAVKYINRSLERIKESKELAEQMDNYFELFNIYKNRKDFSKALEYYEQYNTIKDSINVANAKITIANLEAGFENEKNLLEIRELKQNQEADRKIKLLLTAGIVFLIIIFALLIRTIQHRRKSERLKKELFKSKNEHLEKDLQYKSRQLTSQALLMMQKNSMLDEMLKSLKEMKCIKEDSKQTINSITRRLKQSINSEADWETFRHYFEEVNPDFYSKLLTLNNKITPSELKLSALIKLNFNIKETASLLNISPDSVKTTRHILRTKLQLKKGDNIHEFLNHL